MVSKFRANIFLRSDEKAMPFLRYDEIRVCRRDAIWENTVFPHHTAIFVVRKYCGALHFVLLNYEGTYCNTTNTCERVHVHIFIENRIVVLMRTEYVYLWMKQGNKVFNFKGNYAIY